MIFTIEERPSDSPYVERIWRAHNERAGTFISLEVFAPVWSARTTADDGPGEAGFTDRINRMPKYIASTTLREPVGWNTTVCSRPCPDRYHG
jgi:hypothetical protein